MEELHMSFKSLITLITTLLISGIFYTAFPQNSASKLQHLSERADLILTGKVTKQKSNWNRNKTRIYTEATLQVHDYLKGINHAGSVTVNYPGGEVGDVGELYTHMPRFVNSEDVLLFLKKDKKVPGYQVLDGENGKIEIHKDKITGQEVTSSNIPISDLKLRIKSYLKQK